MSARFGLASGLLAALLLGVLWPAGSLAADCRATVSGELMRKETEANSVVYSFAATTTCSEECAKVDFQLVATVRTADGKESVRRVGKTQRTGRQRDSTMKVRYRLDLDEKLIGWEFKVVGCRPCEAGD